MTADIRTTAQREAETRTLYEDARNYRHLFVEGAVWAQARVTPTREQVAIALAKRKARDWDAMTGMMHIAAIHDEYSNADAILALLSELAERKD